MVCSKCGKEIDDDAVFCMHCGARLDATSDPLARDPEDATARKTGQDGSAVRVIDIIETCVLVALAVVAMLFIFLIRIDGTWMYTYFGDIYKDMQAIVKTKGVGARASVIAEWYVPAVFGTVTYAFGLIAVTSIAVISIVRNVRHVRDAKKKSGEKFALAAVFLYVGITLSLLILRGQDIQMLGVKTGRKGVPDAVTVTSWILCGVLLLGYIVTKAVRKNVFAFVYDDKRIALALCRILSMLNVVLLLVFLVLPIFGVREQHSNSYMNYLFAEILAGSKYLHQKPQALVMFAFVCMASLLFLLLLGTVALALYILYTNVRGGRFRLKSSVWLTVMCSILTGFTIILFVMFCWIMNYRDTDIRMQFANFICIATFAFLQLGAAITHKILSKKFAAEPQLAEATVVV